MKLFHYVMWALLSWVIGGSLTLLYLQSMDGTLFNEPFTMYVDPLNMKTNKMIYHQGDMVNLLTSVCKHREYSARITWKLINETVITYPDTGTRIAGVGCITDKWVPIGVIPPYAVPGLHHIEGVSEIQINPLRKLYFNYRSQDFQVL